MDLDIGASKVWVKYSIDSNSRRCFSARQKDRKGCQLFCYNNREEYVWGDQHFSTPSRGVMSPTKHSAISWTMAILMHLSFWIVESGQSIVMTDIRYIWSAMLSTRTSQLILATIGHFAGLVERPVPPTMPCLFHPSRALVLSRSITWRNAIGEDDELLGGVGNGLRTMAQSAITCFLDVWRPG